LNRQILRNRAEMLDAFCTSLFRIILPFFEGMRFNQSEIVNELIQKSACTKRAVVETEGVKIWRRIVKQEWRKPC